jgi:hypothetical protein
MIIVQNTDGVSARRRIFNLQVPFMAIDPQSRCGAMGVRKVSTGG